MRSMSVIYVICKVISRKRLENAKRDSVCLKAAIASLGFGINWMVLSQYSKLELLKESRIVVQQNILDHQSVVALASREVKEIVMREKPLSNE